MRRLIDRMAAPRAGFPAVGDQLVADNTLPLSVQLQLEEVCNRFEAAWQAAPSPVAARPIEEYIQSAAEPARPALFRELLRLDVVYRRRHGEQPVLADYAARRTCGHHARPRQRREQSGL